jgi:glutathionylspermidine synthase
MAAAAFASVSAYGREGANITMVQSGKAIAQTDGEYGEEGFVYEALIPPANRHHPVIGSWVIGGESASIGIRESDGPVTDNSSQFVPHVFT